MKTNRYIRHILLKDFGIEAQQKLAKAKVLVVGLGGLGVPVVQYLNAMGVGTLGLVENDLVDLTNLQRQVLYAENDLGRLKLDVALEKLMDQNSETTFRGYPTFLTKESALEIIEDYDIVVDASDNFPTRYLVNDACVMLKKPFVYGALHGFEGQVSVFNFSGGPTYRCLFPEMPAEYEIPNCNDNGVLGVIPGIIGNFQALEVVKVITGVGEVMSGKLLIYNGLNQSILKIGFALKPENLGISALRESYEWDSCASALDLNSYDFKKHMDSGNKVQIIDVRTPEEYEIFHLPNSVNIPLNELDRRIKEVNLVDPIYAICQSGKRSKIAVKELQKFSNTATIFNVLGGINSLTSGSLKGQNDYV